MDHARDGCTGSLCLGFVSGGFGLGGDVGSGARRRRGVRYQQQLRVRVQIEQQTNTMQEDLDEESNDYQVNSTLDRDPGTSGTEHDIQRLERALKVAGMA
ncbi:hypothetical protein E4T49_02921 [Aureobasidium sp. EXF-10728]|nr:hypothetical protein E4T49_02921 [Aureobasidium sp. EXF-10728]